MKKKIFNFIVILFCVCWGIFAKSFKVQKNYELSSGSLKEYRLSNKIPVYIKTDVPNQVAAVYIIVKGGTVLQPGEFSGLESSLFKMMTFGSKKYPYEVIQQIQYKNQSSLGYYSLYSGSVFTLNCINYYLDQMIDVFLDGFLNPVFEEKEYSLMMNDLEQNLSRNENDPESILFQQIHQTLYKDSPLLTSSSVKRNSIKNITVENMQKLHKEILDASRIQIVAVGQIDEEKLVNILDKNLGKLKSSKKNFLIPQKQKLNISKNDIVMSHKNATGAELIVRVFETPEVTSSDYVASQITSNILETIMFNIIREKYGACYTPGSQIDSSFNPIGIDYGLRVSDMENFKTYYDECQKIMSSGKVISSVEDGKTVYDTIENCLAGYINTYITRKYSSQSTSSGIASRITSSILQFNDVTSADKIPQTALTVTKEDVMRVFEKYWKTENCQWFIMKGNSN